MAIYHLQANVIQRSKGRSAVAAAAYRAGVELLDERTGLTFDYSAKRGIGITFIIGWPGSRQSLWNAAEKTERRKDSTTAREYVVALPAELAASDRQILVQELAASIHQHYGVVVDVCMHVTKNGNPHAHIMTTTREVCPLMREFGKKSIVDISSADRKKCGLIGTARDELEQLKKDWCAMTNLQLSCDNFRSGVRVRLASCGCGWLLVFLIPFYQTHLMPASKSRIAFLLLDFPQVYLCCIKIQLLCFEGLSLTICWGVDGLKRPLCLLSGCFFVFHFLSVVLFGFIQKMPFELYKYTACHF